MSTPNNREIERKYFLIGLPEKLNIASVMDINQSYLYKDKNTIIRIRKIVINGDTQYVYTVKTKGNIENGNQSFANKYEIESNISKELYEELINKKIFNTVNKKRIVVPIQNNLKVEIDLYHDYLEDFLTAEVEFPSEEDAMNFEKPSWIGEEIGFKEFSNSKLAQMTREILLDKVPDKVIKNNKKIIEELNKV